MPDPITAPCRKAPHYPASKNSGTRRLSDIRLIVLHDTEGGTAESIAAYFASRTSEGSAHIVVDDKECRRCLPDDAIPWAAPNANTDGWHVEHAAFASWATLVWKSHRRMLHRGAYKVAVHCHKFGIPPKFIKARGLAAGRKGVTTHREVSKWSAAAGLPGDHSHTDPGPTFPRWYYMMLVKRYHADLERRR